MQTRLMRKGGAAHIGRLALWHAVENFIQQARGTGQVFQPRFADTNFILAAIGVFQKQGRNQRGQIGIAAALAQTIERALNMARARIYRGQTARNGGFGVIMGMNAQTIPRHARGDYRPRDLANLIRQSAAIRITQNDPPRPRRMRRVNGGQCIILVGLIAIKEMFCIKQRLAPCFHEMGDGGADIFKVFFKADPKSLGHMEIMGFAHQTNRSRARIHHARQNIIIRGRAACAFGHTKGRHGRARVRHRFEKGTVRGVGARPAPFDIIHPQIIEHRSNT